MQQHPVVSVHMGLSWSSDGSRVALPSRGQRRFLSTVVSSNYLQNNGIKGEAIVVSLDASKPQLILEKACKELKGVTTEELTSSW